MYVIVRIILILNL